MQSYTAPVKVAISHQSQMRTKMKRWHLIVFVTAVTVLLYRTAEFAWGPHFGWDGIVTRLTPSEERHIKLGYGYWLDVYPKDEMLHIYGWTLWISCPGSYLVLRGPNCFRDEAVIGLLAFSFTSIALLVGWRRQSWKFLVTSLGVSVAYGWYYHPWRLIGRIKLNPLTEPEVLSMLMRWIWCTRCVSVALMIAVILTGLSLWLIRIRHKPSTKELIIGRPNHPLQ